MPDSGMTAVQVERVKEALEKAKTAIQWTIDDFGKGAPSTAVATAQAAQPLVDEALALFPNPEPEKDWADEVAADIRRVLHAPPDVMNEAELAALIRERCPTHGEGPKQKELPDWTDLRGILKDKEPKTEGRGFEGFHEDFWARRADDDWHDLGPRQEVCFSEAQMDRAMSHAYSAGKQDGQREQRERDADTGRLLLAKWPTCTTHYKNGVRDLMRAIEQEGGRG